MKFNIIDKFLYKLLFLTLILLCVVVLDDYSIISAEKIKAKLSENVNVINVVKNINGKIDLIDLNENTVNVSNNDHIIENVNDNKYLYYLKEKYVYNYSLGNVIEIKKDKNNLYNVIILDENNNLISYNQLKEINVKIYDIVKVNDIIGVANNNNINNGYLYYYIMEINEN